MAVAQQIDGDVVVRGDMIVSGQVSGTISVTNSMVSVTAGIDADKMEHIFRPAYSQESTVNATAGTWVLHVVKGATGVVRGFNCGHFLKPTGTTTATIFDLKKSTAGGSPTSILTAAVTVIAGTVANYVTTPGTLSSTALVAGDVLYVTISTTAGDGNLGKGAFCVVDLDELA